MKGGRLEVKLSPGVLRWARERARLEPEILARKLAVKPERIYEWEDTGKISLSKVDKLAHHTHTPLGYLYLPEPVDDRLPIPDFRTVADKPLARPSPDLLETVQSMQRRQAWMRDELIEKGNERLHFVGSTELRAVPVEVATAMKKTLGLDVHWADAERTWTDALRKLRNSIEDAGVLIVFNGVVGNNTRRKLSTDEFRGFALVDEYAPLIFINGSDFKAAQIFTLIHELAHIWIGQDGVSNFEALQPSPNDIEQFCNRVAAEFLVPEAELRNIWQQVPEEQERYDVLARQFKVSSLVTARRSLDLGLISHNDFFEFYNAWLDDERRQQRATSSGSFWNNQNVRVGKRFGEAVVRAVKEGRLLYRDAYALTGMKGTTFDKYVKTLGAQY
jgi:Zn-dependent peptidase ImmA (M78 family)